MALLAACAPHHPLLASIRVHLESPSPPHAALALLVHIPVSGRCDLLPFDRSIINRASQNQPTVLEILDIVLDCVYTAQTQLLLELVERDQLGRIANELKR